MKTKDKISVKNIKLSITLRIIVFIIVTLALGISLIFSRNIEKALNLNTIDNSPVANFYGGLRVSFVDVGQGDCIFINLPDGKTVLIDSGLASERRKLVNFFDNINFNDDDKVIDYVVATHPHDDHLGNMSYIFNKYKVLNAYIPKVSSSLTSFNVGFKTTIDTKFYGEFLNAVENEKCNVKFFEKNDTIIGNFENNFYEFKFWTEHKDIKRTNLNNFSPIITLTYAGKSFCFTGDAETEIEKEAVASGIGKVDVFKAGHHGSDTSNSQNLLNSLLPGTVVISVGAGNTYKHPTASVLDRFNTNKNISNVYRTDLNGTVYFVVKNNEMSVGFSIGGSVNKVKWLYIVISIETVFIILLASLPYPKKKKTHKKQIKKFEKNRK